MYIAYPRAITETIEELQECAQRLRGTPAAPRVQMLRLLKSGEATNVPQVATLVGYSPRQIQRWWQAYRTAGLAGLTRVYHPAGKPARLTEDAWAGLQVELEAGRMRTLLAFDDAWLREEVLVRRSYPLPLRAIEAGRAEGGRGKIGDEATAAAG
jgi:transposase-like protein